MIPIIDTAKGTCVSFHQVNFDLRISEEYKNYTMSIIFKNPSIISHNFYVESSYFVPLRNS